MPCYRPRAHRTFAGLKSALPKSRWIVARHVFKAIDLPPLDGAKGKLGIADLKEGSHAAEEAFG